MPKASPTNANLSQWTVWVNSGFKGQHLVPLPKGEKGPRAKGWQKAVWTRSEMRDFASAGNDIGLRTKHFPTLDIDADDPEVVDVVLSVVAHDDAIMRKRTGTARCAVIFSGEPNPKALRKYEIDGKGVGIEILGEGQQVKVAGTHPDGSEYYVEGMREAGSVQRLDLTPKELLDRIEDALVQKFGDRLKIKKKSVGGGFATSSHQSREVERGTREQVKEVLDGMPNTTEKLEDYDDVINRVLAPIYGASDGADWGFDLWKEWAQSGDYEGENSDDWVLDKWQSVESTGSRSGLKELRGTARDLGEAGASARSSFGVGRKEVVAQMTEQGVKPESKESEQERAERDKAVAKVTVDQVTLGSGGSVTDPFKRVRTWLPMELRKLRIKVQTPLELATPLFFYDVSGATLYYRRTNAALSPRGRGFAGAATNLQRYFNDAPELKRSVPGANGKPAKTVQIPLAEYLRDAMDIPHVGGFVYQPVGGEFVRENGTVLRNKWVPVHEVHRAMLEVAAGDFSKGKDLDQTPVYDLVMRFFEASGDPKWRELAELFLDWMALVICAPHIKPSIHWFLASESQGTGKSTLAQIIAHLVGPSNYASVDENALTGQFQDYMASRFVWVDEAAGVMQDATGRLNRAVYSKIKSGTQTTSKTMRINPKMQAPYDVANLTAWLILSNHGAEQLGIEADDRRFVVIESDVDGAAVEGVIGKIHGGFAKNESAARVFLARAFARRLWDMWNDPARWGAVTVDRAPDSATKQVQRSVPMSAVATTVRDMLDEGHLTSITTLADVRAAITGRRTVSSSVVNAVANDNTLAKELKGMGAVEVGRRRIGPNGERKRAWALPTDELHAPDPEALDQAELRRQRREWTRKMRGRTVDELKSYYSRGV